jgi:DNA-binding response OmpR family regulator
MQIGVEAQRAVENRRVFVIDEDEVNRAALQFMLADENETHEFAAPEAALAKGASWQPDLALLGARLLERRGADLVQRLRSAWPGVKLLAVCDPANASHTDAARLAGTDDILARPLQLEAVRRKVDRHLGRRVPLKIGVVVR